MNNQERWGYRSRDAVQMWASQTILEIDQSLAIDLGAGNQLVGRLLEDVGIQKYQAFDLLPQSDEVTRIDAAEEDPLPNGDVLFAMGLVEYLPIECRFAERAAEAAAELVVSYVATSPSIDLAGREQRQWKRHQSESGFVDEFLAAGLTLIATRRDRAAQSTWLWRRR